MPPLYLDLLLYEHLFVPGSPYSRSHLLSIIDKAIERRDLDLAWCTAGNLSSQLELDRALRLLVLAGEKEAPSFQPAARRWLVRFITEQRPTVDQIKRTADALNELLQIRRRAGPLESRGRR